MADRKKCVTCGKMFEVCTRCEELSPEILNQYGHIAWKTIACSYECWQVYDVVRRYQYGRLTKQEAKAILDGITLPNIDNEAVLGKVCEIIADEVEETPPATTTKRAKVK